VQSRGAFDEHVVLDAPDVDGVQLDCFAGGGDAHEVAGVGAADTPTSGPIGARYLADVSGQPTAVDTSVMTAP
jgi:hypothetical protein